jgi:Spy/CpxP family protein refolding chaperone
VTEKQAVWRVRAWVVGVGLAGLLCGATLGWAADRVAATWWPANRNEANVGLLEYLKKYGLTREQERQIRMVLRARDHEMLQKYRKHARSLPAPLRSEIMSVRRHADERIYAVLTKDQREQYLKDLPDNLK